MNLIYFPSKCLHTTDSSHNYSMTVELTNYRLIIEIITISFKTGYMSALRLKTSFPYSPIFLSLSSSHFQPSCLFVNFCQSYKNSHDFGCHPTEIFITFYYYLCSFYKPSLDLYCILCITYRKNINSNKNIYLKACLNL